MRKGEKMQRAIHKKIIKWKEKYNKTPNGWAVAQLIGGEYMKKSKK